MTTIVCNRECMASDSQLSGTFQRLVRRYGA